MFTTGFKFFFGISLAALGAAAIFAFAVGDTSTAPDYFGVLDREAFKGIISLGWRGSVGSGILGYVILLTFASVAAFLAFTMVGFRDADPESVAEIAPDGVLPASQGPAVASFWPLAAALGIGTFTVGIATSSAVWILGVAILSVVIFEWAISAWADRMTGDRAVNAKIRNRLMGPIEIPVLGLLGLGVIAVAVSRVLLTVSELNAVIAAGVLALIIFGIALVFVNSPRMGKTAMGGLIGLAMVGIIAAGIVSAAVGEREIEHHGEHGGDTHSETHSEDEG